MCAGVWHVKAVLEIQDQEGNTKHVSIERNPQLNVIVVVENAHSEHFLDVDGYQDSVILQFDESKCEKLTYDGNDQECNFKIQEDQNRIEEMYEHLISLKAFSKEYSPTQYNYQNFVYDVLQSLPHVENKQELLELFDKGIRQRVAVQAEEAVKFVIGGLARFFINADQKVRKKMHWNTEKGELKQFFEFHVKKITLRAIDARFQGALNTGNLVVLDSVKECDAWFRQTFLKTGKAPPCVCTDDGNLCKIPTSDSNKPRKRRGF